MASSVGFLSMQGLGDEEMNEELGKSLVKKVASFVLDSYKAE